MAADTAQGCIAESPGMAIRGLGVAIPPTIRTNDFWPQNFHERFSERARTDLSTLEMGLDGAPIRLDPAVAAAMEPYLNDPFRGARQRHVISEGTLPSELEAQAARQALLDANIHPEAIDVALISSHMPDHLLPSNGPALQDNLGLSNAIVHAVDLACASFISQLLFAASMIRSGFANNVLAVQSTSMSRFIDPLSPACVHFGDGATASVFSSDCQGRGLVAFSGRTAGDLRDGILLAHVDDSGGVAKKLEDTRGLLLLATLDPAAGKQGGLKSAQWCREACGAVLKKAGVGLHDIDRFFCAQSLKWFPDACRRALDLSEDKVEESFDEVANLGGATIPYNLWRAREAGRLREGMLLLLYSPAVGISRMAAILRW